MITLFYFFLFLASCFVLSYSGTKIVKSLIKISRFLNWKSFVVSSLLMGLSTSLPEIFVGITSALHNQSELLLGVIIGSNMIALTILIGMGAIFKKEIKIEKKTIRWSIIYAVLYSLLPFILIKDGSLSRADGIILLASFIFYFSQLVAKQGRFKKTINHQKRNWTSFKLFLMDMLIFSVGLFLLLISSEGIVYSASKIALSFNLSTIIIGIFLVSIGTSLPEITFGVKSIGLKQKNMIIGNAMGSIVTNSTLALGITSLISPITINDFTPYTNGIIFVLITCMFFLIFAETDHTITRKEAFLLIAIYFTFIIMEMSHLNISDILFFRLQ